MCVQSWAILPSKMVGRLESNLLCFDVILCVQACLFTPCHWGEIQRLIQYCDSESNSFTNLLRVSEEDIMEEDQEDVNLKNL